LTCFGPGFHRRTSLHCEFDLVETQACFLKLGQLRLVAHDLEPVVQDLKAV
jgi:hypothetical protein